MGKSLSTDDLANRYGMPETNVRKIQGVCADLGVIVDIRPTTPHAEVMLREGTALPKPEAVKAKTINETDLLIGLGKKEDLGKVGFFDPAVVRAPSPRRLRQPAGGRRGRRSTSGSSSARRSSPTTTAR